MVASEETVKRKEELRIKLTWMSKKDIQNSKRLIEKKNGKIKLVTPREETEARKLQTVIFRCNEL